MPSNKENQSRLYLAYLTEPFEVGDETLESPQHMTLVGTFLASPDLTITATQSAIDSEGIRQFPITVGREDLFGASRDLPAYRIEPVTTALRGLHNALIGGLIEHAGIKITQPQWVLDHYTPHITKKPHRPELEEGQMFTVDHVAIMQKDSKIKRLIAKEALRS